MESKDAGAGSEAEVPIESAVSSVGSEGASETHDADGLAIMKPARTADNAEVMTDTTWTVGILLIASIPAVGKLAYDSVYRGFEFGRFFELAGKAIVEIRNELQGVVRAGEGI